MAFFEINLPPGVYRNGTELQSGGRWYDTNLVRWVDKTLRPIGGWRQRSDDSLTGKARAVIAWKDDDANTWLGVGTHSKLYVSNRTGTIFNITPFRDTGHLTNPIATTNTDATVTVTDVAHGLAIGDTAFLSGAASTGGLDVNGSRTVATVPSADTWTFEHASTATSTVAAGGGTVTYRYTKILTNPFSTTNTSTTVTVAHTAHGLAVGEGVWYDGASAVGGITIDGEYTVVTVPGANSYTITHSAAATSTAGPGGGSVTYGYEISPGRADAVAQGGYGDGDYGDSGYGTPRADETLIQDATVWSLDTWGEYFVGCHADNSNIWQWDLDTAVRAYLVADSPTAKALVTTEQKILMALGAEGVPRRVKWCDQEDNTEWAAAATNQAGDYDLHTAGRLMCGVIVSGGALLFTDVDVHKATYTADTLVYRFDRAGDQCGVASRGAVAVFGSQVAWMSSDGFWTYNGYAQSLPCDVFDYVFSDINRDQMSKVTAVHNSTYFEITWYYPSADSTENDRYVTWNYGADPKYWIIGTLSRTCGVDKGIFVYPIKIDASGVIREHEVGFDYDDGTPYAESGPVQIGAGDRTMVANYYIPDERTEGQVTITFKVKNFPNDTESTFGPYEAAQPRGVRFSGRQAKIRYEGVGASAWRVGVGRVDVKMASGR